MKRLIGVTCAITAAKRGTKPRNAAGEPNVCFVKEREKPSIIELGVQNV